MKLLSFSIFPSLLFFSSLLGRVASEQVLWDLVKSSHNVTKAGERETRSLQEAQQVKPELGLPWMLVYVPMRSCHRVLKEKLGEFSPPTYNSFQVNIWCNWTIWAGSRKHIIIYIKGFMSNEDCIKNEDKILFQGVSSLVENTVIYACWNKKLHVFATYARAVHVVFLMKYASSLRNKSFKGKYYIFKQRDIDSSSKDTLVSQAPTSKPTKTTSHSTLRSCKPTIIYHGEKSDYTKISTTSSMENLNSNFNKTNVLNNTGLLQVVGKGPNIMILESSLPFIPQRDTRTQFLKTETLSWLKSLNLSTKSKDKGKSLHSGKLLRSLPQTLVPDRWELRILSEEVGDSNQVYRPKNLPSFISEGPHLSVSHLNIPLKAIALGPESRMSFSLSSLRPTDIGNLQLTAKPTHLSYPVLASCLHSVAHDRVETIGDNNIDSIPSQCLGRVTLVNDDSLLQSNTLAFKVMSTPSDSLAKVSLPSLRVSSQNDVVFDQLHLVTRDIDKAGSYDISSTRMVGGDKFVTELDLRTTLKNINLLGVSPLESSFKLIDQLKIPLVTTAPYSMSENEHRSRLQSNQHVDLAVTEISSIFPTTTAIFPSTELLSSRMQDQISVSAVVHLGMKSSQQVVLAMDLEPISSTEISLPVLMTELEPVIPLPHTDASFPPAASELGPLLFPSTEVSLPAFPREMEPVIPFLSTEMSLPLASSELGLISSLGTEVTFPLSAVEMVLVASSRDESLPLAAQGTSALSGELHLGTKSSHFIDVDTVLDHIHQSTAELLHPAPGMEDLWEDQPRSHLHRDHSGDPPATEHGCGFPSATVSLNSFLAERKLGVQQLILKGKRKDRIHEAEPRNVDESNLITSLITGNISSDTTKLEAIKPEPERGLPRSEGNTRKLSPGTEYLARTPQWVTRMNRVKQDELMLKNGLVAANTKATPPLEHITMNTKVKLTEPIKETSNKMVRQIFPETTKHHEVQETAGWSGVPQISVSASSDALAPVEKVALKESINSHSVQSSSDHISEGPSTSEARQLLNYSEPEFPWLLVYLPVRSCHVIFKDEIGKFSPPTHSGVQTNIWCNWTIWAGPQKHILIYIKGFQGKEDCDENSDKIIFQGILSSVERRVVYACKNQGTLIFATQALAVHVVFLSRSNLNHEHTYFKGQYYVFKDYETSRSTNDTVDSQDLVQKRTRKTKYSSIRFYPKSSIKHYRGLLDFMKTSIAHNENQQLNKLPMLDKEGWNKTSSSKSLEAFLRSVLGNNTHTSLLKAMDNKTFSMPVHKGQLSMKSLGNEDQSREEKPSDLLMVTPELNTLRQNIQNNKKQSIAFGKLIHRPTIHSNLLSETLYLKKDRKPVEIKSVKPTRKSAGPQHDSTILWRPASMEDLQPDAREAIFGNSASHHGLQSKPVNHERVASQPAAFVDDFQSNSRLTEDGQEVTGQLQPVMNLERSIKESRLEHPTHRKENNKGDLYMKPATALKNVKLDVEPLILETTKKVVETEAELVTVVLHDELGVSPLKASSYSYAASTTVEYRPVLSSTRSGPLVTVTAATHLGTPVTRDKEPPPITSTKSHPSYPSSDVVPKDTESLKEHKTNSFDAASIFTSLENDTMLESRHNPGDVLFEVTSEIDHKGLIPRSGNELKKALMESIKLHIQKNLKLLISKVNEIKFKEIKRMNDLKPTLTFWLHLKPEERNMSVLLHSQLNDLIGKSVGAEELQLSLLSVRDVNECNSGIGVCGDEADCLNEEGTYLCRCKEEYEDRSPAKSGTLCVRIPRTGISGFFSFMEILVGATVFFIFILVVVASSLCIILRKRYTKKDSCIQEPVSTGIPSSTQSQLPVPSIDLSNLGDHLTRDPFQPKLRAKPPDWASQVQANPNETYRIFVEQSECL